MGSMHWMSLAIGVVLGYILSGTRIFKGLLGR